jgi:hypothetical protein
MRSFFKSILFTVLLRFDDIRAVKESKSYANSVLFVVGCGKEVEKHFHGIKKNIELLINQFEDFRIKIYSDSSSFESFLNWSKDDPNHVVVVKEEFQHISRTVRIAFGRNMLLSMIKHEANDSMFISKEIFVVVLDFDDVNISPIDMDVFSNVMRRKNEWDVVTFHRQNYYDIWSLRYSRFDVNIWNFGLMSHTLRDIIEADIVSLLDTSDPKGSFFPVISAFNGFAIYKMDTFGNCTYDGTNAAEKSLFPRNTIYNISRSSIIEDCEHVSLHRCMYNRGLKIRIFTQPVFPDRSLQ